MPAAPLPMPADELSVARDAVRATLKRIRAKGSTCRADSKLFKIRQRTQLARKAVTEEELEALSELDGLNAKDTIPPDYVKPRQ